MLMSFFHCIKVLNSYQKINIYMQLNILESVR